MSEEGRLPGWITHAGAFLLGRLTTPEKTPARRLKREGLRYLAKVVTEWRPVNCNSEADCQLALHNYLLGRFSEDRLIVDAQYGSGTSRVDLVVEHEYAVEIKFEIDNENEINRLKGQVDNLQPQFKGVLVVICGGIREEVQYRLERSIGSVSVAQEEELTSAVVVVPVVQRQTTRPRRKTNNLAQEDGL